MSLRFDPAGAGCPGVRLLVGAGRRRWGVGESGKVQMQIGGLGPWLGYWGSVALLSGWPREREEPVSPAQLFRAPRVTGDRQRVGPAQTTARPREAGLASLHRLGFLGGALPSVLLRRHPQCLLWSRGRWVTPSGTKSSLWPGTGPWISWCSLGALQASLARSRYTGMGRAGLLGSGAPRGQE